MAQYHSVDSVTGMFMIRQGDLKLIVFGENTLEPASAAERHFAPQLFNLTQDPWELHDLAAGRGTVLTHHAPCTMRAISVACKFSYTGSHYFLRRHGAVCGCGSAAECTTGDGSQHHGGGSAL